MARSELSQASESAQAGPGWAVRGTRILIRGYQLVISPLLGPRCRHLPSCSDYALEAVTRFGALRGGWLAFCRIIRCNPWGTSGYDPVPDRPRRR